MKKILMLSLSLLLLFSCKGSMEEKKDGLAGQILIDGSSTVAPITNAVTEDFRKDHPEVDISVGISGTGGGFKKFVTGEIDIANASRPIKKEEAEKAKENGVEFIELKIALDGLTVAVNKENNWISDITAEELKKMWQEGSPVANWKDLNPSYPDLPLKLYGPDQDSGTYDYFVEEILGKDGQMRKDYSPSSDDNQLVLGVEGDKGAVGFFGYAYYLEQKDKLKALKINGIEPLEENVKSGKYVPLSRPLFIYINKKALADKPQVKSFVAFYLEKAPTIVGEVGYVPLDSYTEQVNLIK